MVQRKWPCGTVQNRAALYSAAQRCIAPSYDVFVCAGSWPFWQYLCTSNSIGMWKVCIIFLEKITGFWETIQVKCGGRNRARRARLDFCSNVKTATYDSVCSVNGRLVTCRKRRQACDCRLLDERKTAATAFEVVSQVFLSRLLWHHNYQRVCVLCPGTVEGVWKYGSNHVNIHRHQSFIFSKSIMDNRWQRLSFNAKLAHD